MINNYDDYAFRAWDKDRERFHYGSSNVMMDTSGLIFWQFGMNNPEPVKQTEFIIQRYTTMDDKHDAPIHDGDILNWYGHYHVVFWNSFMWSAHGDKGYHLDHPDWIDSTIVGNIFEGITIRERLGTGFKDGDGMEICIGDHISSAYGIPPVRIKGKVELSKGGLPFIETPGHNPAKSYLRGFIENLGVVYIDTGIG